MKGKLILALILTFVFGGLQTAQAQVNQEFRLQVNRQKTVAGGRLTVKFLSVLEDSRCPADANCVWAGNAKVQIKVSRGRGKAKIFELNTNLAPQIVTFEGYEIKMGRLTPHPRTNIRINRNGYTATFTVKRL
jgi:hypothetical protein